MLFIRHDGAREKAAVDSLKISRPMFKFNTICSSSPSYGDPVVVSVVNLCGLLRVNPVTVIVLPLHLCSVFTLVFPRTSGIGRPTFPLCYRLSDFFMFY